MPADPKIETVGSELAPRRLGLSSRGSYCFVQPGRRKRSAQPKAPEASPEFDEVFGETEDARKTIERLQPTRRAFAAYRDPDLCSCERMRTALRGKNVMVVVGGPVTLPPGVFTEEAILRGEVEIGHVERAYDGMPWAFRFCPFEDDPVRLLDEQVPAPEMLQDGLACCATMALAVAHGRVELPAPERHGRESPKFTATGRPGTLFCVCPWCATSMLDLGIARLKRHHAAKAASETP